jgi:hypothetical protein
MTSSGPSLLASVHGLLERTYHMRSGIRDVADYLIGDHGFRELFSDASIVETVCGASACGARTLLRETPDGLRVCVYFPDELIRRLEAYPPQRGIGARNVDAFATFVEEIDHLLVVAERLALRQPISLFELELHANVSKHLVLTRYLAGRGPRLSEVQRIWLRRCLFGAEYCDDDAEVAGRYREAARWAVRLLDAAGRLAPAQRLEQLRRFHREEVAGKLRLIEYLAA